MRSPHTKDVEVRQAIQRMDIASQAVADSIASVNESITSISESVTAISESVGSAEDAIDSLDSRVTELEGDSGGLSYSSELAEDVTSTGIALYLLSDGTVGIADAGTAEKSMVCGLAMETGTTGETIQWAAAGALTLEEWPVESIIVPGDVTVTYFGEITSPSRMWNGGALAANGCIYCSPYSATTVLKINPSSGTISQFGTLSSDIYKWRGAVANAAGTAVYCPSNYPGHDVLKINTTNDTTSVIGTWNYAWSGGVLAGNGKIYFAPADSTFILVIDTADDSVAYITGPSSTGSRRWDGAVLVGEYVYFVPYDETNFVKLTVATGANAEVGENHGAGSGKWAGGALASNGCIYCAPYNATSVLKIDTASDTSSTIGTLSSDTAKWRGVIIPGDGYLYCVPCSANSFLRIDPSDDSLTEVTIDTSGAYYWFSACLGADGAAYCVPADAASVLKAVFGEVTEETLLNVGSLYYLGASGEMTDEPSEEAGDSITELGLAVAADTLDVRISRPILL